MKVLEDWAGLREALNYTGSCSSPSLNSHRPGEQMRTPLILSKPLIHTQLAFLVGKLGLSFLTLPSPP